MPLCFLRCPSQVSALQVGYISSCVAVHKAAHLWIVLVCYNLCHIFVVLDVISVGYDNIVLTKVIAGIWERSNIATMTSNMARSTQDQTG